MSDQATFRGVPFLVETSELEGGRATVKHGFPLRADQYVEDVGLRGRVFPVEGFVLGAGANADADAQKQKGSLLAALEQSGPGELVHPKYGRRTVAVTSYRVRESVSEGRIVRFSISFDETDAAPPFPTATRAPQVATEASQKAALLTVQAQVSASETDHAVLSQPTMLGSLSATLKDATASMQTALAPLIAAQEDLASFTSQVNALKAQASSLVRAPWDAVSGLLGALEAAGSSMSPDFVLALLDAAAFTPSSPRPVATTSTRQAQQDAYDLLLWALRMAALLRAALLAPGCAFESYDQAVGVREGILAQLDGLADGAGDDTYQALQQLRADLVAGVPGAQDLPHLASYTPPATVPSIVIAYQLHGDTSRELDLCARNGLAKPGFVRGAVALEVLADG
jgi:prophage DNA circulation protein